MDFFIVNALIPSSLQVSRDGGDPQKPRFALLSTLTLIVALSIAFRKSSSSQIVGIIARRERTASRIWKALASGFWIAF